MHHIVLGIDPTPLGQAPFTLATNRAVVDAGERPRPRRCPTPASTSDRASPATSAPTPPGRSCRRDRTAPSTCSCSSTSAPTPRSCSATGISSSRRRARPGRRSRAPRSARVSAPPPARSRACASIPITLEPRLKVIGVDVWSDDPAFAAEGRQDGRHRHLRVGDHRRDRRDVPRRRDRSRRCRARRPRRALAADRRRRAHVLVRAVGRRRRSGARIAITQNDVRAIQLAKAALRAGIDLLDRARRQPPVTDIRLAGAFGAHIDPLHAMVLGLVPDCPLDGVRSVGNAAGTGAVQALLSRELRAEMERAVAQRHQDRDRDRAAVPGAVRGGDGVPARHRADHQPRAAGRAAGTDRGIASDGRSGRAAAGADRRPGDDGRHQDPTRRAAARGGRRCGPPATDRPRRSSTRTMKPFEIVSDEGLELLEHNADTILEEVGVEIRDYPSALERFRDAGADVSRHTRALPAWAVPSDRAGDGARRLHAARPQPGAQRADRRRRHRVRAELRLAVRARPRQRPALRHDRRLRELREARLHVAVPAPLGRHRVRAGRRAGPQAAPRHGVRPPPLQRQAVHGLGHGRRARRRLGRVGADRRSAATSRTAR